MIDHAFKPHEVWTSRDQCEHRLDEEKDGAYGICAAPRSEHMDEVHVLKVQLATALKERDTEKARAESCFVAMTLAQDRATEAQQALAAARRECDAMRKALEPFAKLADRKDGWPADSGCAHFPTMAQVRAARAAIAAPASAAGEDSK